MEKTIITFEIICYEREFCIEINKTDKEQVLKVLSEYYNFWHDDKGETLGDVCVEEYMEEGLETYGICFSEL